MADQAIPLVDGDDSFVYGMDSYSIASKLNPGEYTNGMNIICRGGIAQTRPGSRSLINCPKGNFQGIKLFKPTQGAVQMVFAVDGLVYVSSYPFKTYTQLPNIQFNKNSRQIAWAVCLQSTYFDGQGVIKYLDTPISTLIMQDGATRAAFWNGVESRHLNPTLSNSTTTIPGYDETPVGLWMVWSNNRLWVSRDGQIFASDIGNPLKFTEAQYLNEARAFYLSGPCTGMIETSDQQGIICFTQDNGVFLQTSIQVRTQWLTMPGFQKTVLPNIGCVSGRSVVHQYGLIWWYSPIGLINQDDALRINITSRLDIRDIEMAASKAYINYDLSTICSGQHENFMFYGVPYGSKINTRIHVLDQAPFEQNVNSWPSYWTGWRPIEFTSGSISSRERVFCGSIDYDGENRIWELFRSEKNDNGIPITSFVQTRSHLFQNRDYKRFKYAEVEMCNIEGKVAVKISAAGTKGAYQTIGTKDIEATVGQAYSDFIYTNDGTPIGSSRPQTRIIKSQDIWDPSACNSECIESDHRGLIDKSFSIAIIWSGVAGVNAYRLFAESYFQAYQGNCELDETGKTLLLNDNGCGSTNKIDSLEQFDMFYATATVSATDTSDITATKTSIQSSSINQQDANRKAIATANWYVYDKLGYEI